MSPRLIGIFAGLVMVTAAAATYFLVFDKEALRVEVVEDRSEERVVAPAREPKVILPTFDIVRVDAAGTAVIAGRGAPKGVVIAYSNGLEVAREEINRDGEWAVYIESAFDSGAIELTLEMILPGGEVLRGEQVVVIAVPMRDGEKPLVVLGEPGEPSRVLQNPNSIEDTLVLTLDIVDYDAEGTLVLSGRAMSGVALRVYANNALIGETRASGPNGAGQGRWTLRPDGSLAPGIYTLRIDQVDETGKVKMRVELPLERAEPADVLAAVATGGGRVVVQPGNSLWRIARRIYGSGIEYTVIYDANRRQIRDPNRIYPGQIFDLPER
jgi:LysM domain-containing protein